MSLQEIGNEVGNRKNRRKVWIAIIFSFLLPGLGQLYNGQVRKGVIFYLFSTVLGFLLMLIAGKSLSLGFIASAFLFIFSIQIVAAFDAGKTSYQIGDNFQPARYNRLLFYFVIYLIFGSLVSGASSYYIRENVIQAFKIPAGSMQPTLLIGDHILIDKEARTFSRGDIIVFEFPPDSNKKNPRDFIKRIIGLPGDKIEVREKHLYVNGSQVGEDYIAHFETGVIPADIYPRDFFGPVTVPENMFFVMGDNRDRSFDSRFWGYVSLEKVHGKAVRIYWSWAKEENKVRWERIGNEIL